MQDTDMRSPDGLIQRYIGEDFGKLLSVADDLPSVMPIIAELENVVKTDLILLVEKTIYTIIEENTDFIYIPSVMQGMKDGTLVFGLQAHNEDGSINNNYTIDTSTGAIICSFAAREKGKVTLSITASDSGSTTTEEITVINQLPINLNTVPKINMNGDYVILLEKDATFTDPGYTVNITPDEESIIGTVNTSVPGIYPLTYKVVYNGIITTQTRYIWVKSKYPEITTIGTKIIELDIGDTYTDAGATSVNGSNDTTKIYKRIVDEWIEVSAIDLTASGIYKYEYSTQSPYEGITAYSHRLVIIKEPPPVPETAPTITINGDADMQVAYNNVYNEPGATVTTGYPLEIVIEKQTESGWTTVTNIDTTIPNALYRVTYTTYTQTNHVAIKRARYVHIGNDDSLPVVQLIGSSAPVLDIGDTYTEEGISGTNMNLISTEYFKSHLSNWDPVTSIDTTYEGRYKVVYTVENISGTRTLEIERFVTVTDLNADPNLPTININGSEFNEFVVGTVYNDPGATVTPSTYSLNAPIIEKYTDGLGYEVVANIDENIATMFRIKYVVDIPNSSVDMVRYRYIHYTPAPNTNNEPIPTISLIGDVFVDVDIGQAYVDEGYLASNNYNDTTEYFKEVAGGWSPTTQIFTDQEDNYKIVYTVESQSGAITKSIERIVSVRDLSAIGTYNPPNITLNGDVFIELNIGDSYTELGATTDGNGVDIEYYKENNNLWSLTGSITTTAEGNYKVVYSSENDDGQVSKTFRIVIVRDASVQAAPPNIALNGDVFVELQTGDTYNEAGVSTDASTYTTSYFKENNDSWASIGSLDTSLPGAYKIVYTAQNGAGTASASISRIVFITGQATSNPSNFNDYALSLNPVAFYKLNETSGTVVNDSSNNNNNGIYNGQFTFNNPGLLLNDANDVSIKPNGTDSYISTNISGLKSLAILCKMSDGDKALAGAGTNNDRWLLYAYQGNLKLYVNNGTGSELISVPVDLDTIVFIVLTYNTVTSKTELWINGAIVGDTSENVLINYGASSNLTIAKYPNQNYGYWDKDISNILVFSNNLTEEEILKLFAYSRINSADYKTLKDYINYLNPDIFFDMQENSGNLISSTGSINATVYSGVTYNAASLIPYDSTDKSISLNNADISFNFVLDYNNMSIFTLNKPTVLEGGRIISNQPADALLLRINPNTYKYELQTFDGTDSSSVDYFSILPNKIYSVAAVIDATNQRISINNRKIPAIAKRPISISNTTHIGRYQSNNEDFTGDISIIAIWNTALTTYNEDVLHTASKIDLTQL